MIHYINNRLSKKKTYYEIQVDFDFKEKIISTGLTKKLYCFNKTNSYDIK